MEDSTRKADRPGRDAFHAAVFERDVESRAAGDLRPSTRGTRPHKQTIWYPLKWIGINIVVITALAVLYAKVLIPHLQAYWNQQSLSRVRPADPPSTLARSNEGGSPAVSTTPRMGQFPGQPPFEIGTPIERQRLRREQDRYSRDAARAIGYECLGQLAYTKRVVNGVTVVANDPTIRCD